MIDVMFRFLNVGESLQDVVRRAALNPPMKFASLTRPLNQGAEADVAVLRWLEGHCGFVDVNGARLSGTWR